jgi:hypothetical protein
MRNFDFKHSTSYQYLDRQDIDNLGFTYVQGMNVLAAPFLYTMPSEVEAFFCFAKFIEESCPLYVQPTLEGVHQGLKVGIYNIFLWRRLTFMQLLDRCLQFVDPELFSHLRSKNLSAEIYAFPCAYFFDIIFLPFKGVPSTFSCFDPVCMHSAFGSSIAIMGLSTGIWSASECSLRNRSTSPHEG